MLDARRSNVSVTAGHLKKRGLIQYNRTNIQILDRRRLETTSCECYRVLRDHLRDISQFDNGFICGETLEARLERCRYAMTA
jgi:Mn-dependent DtxR family transcriptional regulator